MTSGERNRGSAPGRALPLAVAALACVLLPPVPSARAQKLPAPLDGVVFSTDVDRVALSFTAGGGDDCLYLRSDRITTTDLCFTSLVLTDVDAAHHRGFPFGFALYSFDSTIRFANGVVAHPGDVISLRQGGDFVPSPDEATMYFDHAADGGLDDSADVDAITEEGDDLLLSFESTTVITRSPLVVAHDEDLVLFDVNGLEAPAIFFDGSLQGVPQAVDLDGADLRPDGRLIVSFDVAGTVPGADGPIAFEDEDLLVFDLNEHTWLLLWDASATDPDLAPADIDAIAAVELDELTATPTDTAPPTSTPTPTETSPPGTETPTSTPTRTAGGPTDTPTATVTSTRTAGGPTDTPTATPTTTPTPDPCPGDCGNDGAVDVSELIRGVNIALGRTDVGGCTRFDANANGSVEIDELVAAVRVSLDSCG